MKLNSKQIFEKAMERTGNLQKILNNIIRFLYKNSKIEDNLFYINEDYHIHFFLLPYSNQIYLRLVSKKENTDWFGNNGYKKCDCFMEMKNEIDNLIDMIVIGDYILL